MKFRQAVERVLGHEGLYVNDPKDPGGETKWGISKRSYPMLDIKNLTREDAIAIYQRDFWDIVKLDDAYDGVVYQIMDFAVNSGPGNAIRALQRSCGVAPDGRWGPISATALTKMSETDLIMLVLAERLEFMAGLKNWADAGKGWARRIATNLRYGAEDS